MKDQRVMMVTFISVQVFLDKKTVRNDYYCNKVNKVKMKLSEQNPDLLKTKTHFEILDGLRGIAAVAVVIFHFMEFAIPDYTKNFIAHGYLAVDFFFCLSGFVIAYAYDNRIKKDRNYAVF